MDELQREQAIQGLSEMLRTMPFQVDFKVKKKPQGIKIVIEVTQEQMDDMVDTMAKKSMEG